MSACPPADRQTDSRQVMVDSWTDRQTDRQVMVEGQTGDLRQEDRHLMVDRQTVL